MDLSYDGERFAPRQRLRRVPRRRRARARGQRAAAGLRVVSRNQLRQSASVAFSPRVDLDARLQRSAPWTPTSSWAGCGSPTRPTDRRQPGRGALLPAQRHALPLGLECTAGAAELSVLGLGNSRCDRLDFEGGMGKVTLDFGGAWTSSSQVGVKMAVGELTLRLPRQAGRPRLDGQVPLQLRPGRDWSAAGRRASTRRATTGPTAS